MASAKDVANRVPITACLMLATVMTTLDSTIANVALPHMQGSFSATQDQMAWVLTSYIVAAAVMTPLTGWAAGRIGRRQMFLIAIAGFTVASMLCGSATSLAEMVIYRVLQGFCGACMIPLSQSVMLDLFPPHQVGQMMSIWGAGTLLGPVFGPLIGGWLTQDFSWRWVFYINVPLGLATMAGAWVFMSPDRSAQTRRLDFIGYLSLVAFITGLQLVLDRGPTQDWFSSPEIWTEAIVSGIGLYIFLVQTLTAEKPFFDRALFTNTNFLLAMVFSAVISVLLFSTMALQPPMMQGLMNYPVLTTGIIMMPRGVGSLLSMLIAGQLVGRVDLRLITGFGLVLSTAAMLQMSQFDLSMTDLPFITSGMLQGFSTGFMFVPMTTVAFGTLDPRLRPDGTSAFAMMRSLTQSVGISIMVALFTVQTAVAHGDLSGAVQPSNPVFDAGMAGPATPGALEALNAEITRQASMIGYIDVYHLMFVSGLIVMPLALLLRIPKQATPAKDIVME